MKKYILDMDKYKSLARQAGTESCVLLKNDDEALPLKADNTISVFGRNGFNYYKSGTGSGGLVNTKYVVGIIDALKDRDDIKLNEELIQVYEDWIEDHPFEKGQGWGQEPWTQEEMPISMEEVEKAASKSDMALVIIGRTAGEDQDTKAEAGSYYLSETEEQMLEKVTKAFENVVVVLNVGNIIDMKWVDTYNPSAVIYVWQGGQEGGNGVADVLCGDISPSGKLPDTIAYNVEDYPSSDNFGGEFEAIYAEDIYVGYRYFETFAKDKVQYPFGFGLSYTTFDFTVDSFVEKEDTIEFDVEVENTGYFPGKEVIQVYVNLPQGKLGNPLVELKAFQKTKELKPNTKESLHFSIPKSDLSSYDDSGVTGHKSCYVLEAGNYNIYLGNSIRNTSLAGTFTIDKTIVVEQLEEVCAPVQEFKRIKPVIQDESLTLQFESVPTRTIEPMDKIKKDRPEDLTYTGDKGYKLSDVYDGKIDMDTFISQLSDEELACIVRGEGMNSPKVTPGTASAFGGITESLKEFGIPAGCCSDGPSGIRMDNGTEAFSLPNGTALGATFNEDLVEELYQMEGMELRSNKIDTLLGPGINIHRNPLNGRNFEYISEDPYLTGIMAKAQVEGMAYAGVIGTMKHFAANNQEFSRRKLNSVVSERALREIYLKGFEIAVKEGGACSIMTSYGAINGIWTAGNYDLCTRILREEWDFKGIVMTDWWAEINDEGGQATRDNTAAIVRAQNDLYMVVLDAESNSNNDNSLESMNSGKVTRGEFQRSAKNICNILMKAPAMDYFLDRVVDDVEVIGDESDIANEVEISEYYTMSDDLTIDLSNIDTSSGNSVSFGVTAPKPGMYKCDMKMRANAKELAQMSMSVFVNNNLVGMTSLTGADKDWTNKTIDLGFMNANCYIKLYFSMSGMELESMYIYEVESDLTE